MTKPNFDRYRNSEFLQYMKDVLELVNAQDVDTLQLTAPRDELQNVAAQMDELFQKEQSSGITQELIDLDERRDKAFMGLKGLLEAHEKHYEDTVQTAARSLLFHLNSYGTNIPRMNYQAETAVIDSMLADWNTETDLAAAVTTLRITDWVGELTAANEAFNNRFLARISESAADANMSFTTMRVESIDVYQQLIAHIQAHATLGSNAAHQTLLSEVDELAIHYNNTVNTRIRNTSGSDELPTDDAAPNDGENQNPEATTSADEV